MASGPDNTPSTCTTTWSLFPPRTRELQFDEKWSYVNRKQTKCDPSRPADRQRGDYWDHVGYDPEHRLVLGVIPGTRSVENTEAIVADVRRRTGGRVMNLITSDEYSAYKSAILRLYGVKVRTPRTGKPGRPRNDRLRACRGLKYAVVEKTRAKGRIVKVAFRRVYGTQKAIDQALAASAVSRSINTAFLERQNGTDRHRNARKVRKTYRFSKDWQFHEAATYFTMYSYNFCWAVRTLRVKDEAGKWQQRSPAMAAGLTDHLWSMSEWLAYPAVQ